MGLRALSFINFNFHCRSRLNVFLDSIGYTNKNIVRIIYEQDNNYKNEVNCFDAIPNQNFISFSD